MGASKSLFSSAVVPFRFVFLMWVAFCMDFLLGFHLSNLGITPRTTYGLIGIATAPLLHANIPHLVSNTIPMIFLGGVLFYFYPKVANKVFISCYFFTNVMVWVFARGGFNHIGASGLIYGLAFFLMFFGVFRKDMKSIFISLVVILLYSGLFFGLFPTIPGISWESHLFGGVVGVIAAYYFSKSYPTSSK